MRKQFKSKGMSFRSVKILEVIYEIANQLATYGLL
jgi:hypothetical protein